MNRIAIGAVIGIMIVAGCLSGTPAPAGSPTEPRETPTQTTPPDHSPKTPTETSPPPARPGQNISLVLDTSPSARTYQVRVALIREFTPGTTFGMPRAYTNETIQETIQNHSDLADRLQTSFNTTSQRDLFHRIHQYHQIALTEVSNGTYAFTINDGQTCRVRTINGTYQQATDSITVTNQTTKTVPC